LDPSTEYDAAWKATLETFLQPCLSLAFPRLADQIDWSAPPRFLDTELQEIVRDSDAGPMRVDKLVEVMRLIHWLLALPEEEELGLRKDVKQMEASMETKRRSTYERIVWEEGLVAGREQGLERGRAQGRYDAMREGLLDQVAERFGPCSEGLRARVQSIQDESELRQLGRAILKVSTLDEFEARAGANPQSGI
jgi:hypothetical protein